ncbi:hypothetical protein [Xylophilus ampelinus]|uniref:Uncharacterized protein n=1 Tax=Xylophilus ampelinus TaxID=54067 RepID=A0A318SKQ7_9BURK|nr:hypothetical protein [Xylophilus ampelinus]MCS4510932.1 hypothetical protein [Xylophilus ampelinus]PYE76092.1 hypothetical protein DFQ15_11652 [Xylophilus ampelinus]
MNVALPALIVFLILLPGFVFRAGLKRSERVTFDYSPFGQVVAEAVLRACVLRMVRLLVAFLANESLALKILMLLLSSDPAGQSGAIAAVGRRQSAVVVYFASRLAASFALPTWLRRCVTRYSEAITLNIHYIALEPASEEPRASAS